MGSMKGSLLGFANTIVIAAAIAMTETPPRTPVFIIVMVYGAIPGVMAGILLGILADLVRLRPMFRIPILLAPAAALVALLGTAFELPQLILPACIPTLVSVLILERWTRPKPPDIPIARAV